MKLLQFTGVALSLLASLGTAQAPNELAKYNPNEQTMSVNGTFFLVPVATADVAKAIAPRKLLPVPSDKGLFPNGFPAGKHPVLIRQNYGNDIRQQVLGIPLYIPALLAAEASVPFVDALSDGKTPFTLSLGNFIGGVNGQDVQSLIPALVGSLEGNTIYTATFDPNNRAYSILAGPTYSSSVKKIIVPNPISGPGVYPNAIDTQFYSAKDAGATARAFHKVLNLPIIIKSQPGRCQRATYYFNDTYANPQLGRGRVTLYSPALSGALTGGANAGKQFVDTPAYVVVGQQVVHAAETCADAARNVDPAALK